MRAHILSCACGHILITCDEKGRDDSTEAMCGDEEVVDYFEGARTVQFQVVVCIMM